MIAALRGQLLLRDSEGLVVDVGGVGYQVFVSMNTFHNLPPKGQEVSLEIHTHVREDQISLYGFGLPGERALFRYLNEVSGIGPRLALAILSGLAPADLANAVVTGQTKILRSVSGVGKRLAERIVVELQDKLSKATIDFGEGPVTPSPAAAGSGASPHEADLVAALSALGYSKSEIGRTLKRLPMEGADASLQQLLRGALKILGSGARGGK